MRLEAGPQEAASPGIQIKLVVIYFTVVTIGKVETLFRLVTVVTVVTVFVKKSCLVTEVPIMLPVRLFGAVVRVIIVSKYLQYLQKIQKIYLFKNNRFCENQIRDSDRRDSSEKILDNFSYSCLSFNKLIFHLIQPSKWYKKQSCFFICIASDIP